MTGPLRTQFPPRGPRANHIKIDVSTNERKQWEELARGDGLTVVETIKKTMRERVRRGDVEPAVRREAESHEGPGSENE